MLTEYDEEIIQEATEAVNNGLMAGYAVGRLLDIINRQNAEIDILIRKNETLKDEVSELQLKNASYNAEIERLKDIAKGALNESINICDFILDAKAEAIKEFADKLMKKLMNQQFQYQENIIIYIDNLVKEMVGDCKRNGR